MSISKYIYTSLLPGSSNTASLDKHLSFLYIFHFSSLRLTSLYTYLIIAWLIQHDQSGQTSFLPVHLPLKFSVADLTVYIPHYCLAYPTQPVWTNIFPSYTSSTVVLWGWPHYIHTSLLPSSSNTTSPDKHLSFLYIFHCSSLRLISLYTYLIIAWLIQHWQSGQTSFLPIHLPL